MRALIVYESVYGNTRQIAEEVAAGIREHPDGDSATVVPAAQAADTRVDEFDLLVVGGPTHAWSMSRPRTRAAAVDAAGKPSAPRTVEPDAAGPGAREWLACLPPTSIPAAAFDTRRRGAAALTGRASRGIRRELLRAGAELVRPPESFLVTKADELVDGERDRARRWGRSLVA